MTNQRCNECDKYEKQGHNYCRMCGFHVRKGYVPHMFASQLPITSMRNSAGTAVGEAQLQMHGQAKVGESTSRPIKRVRGFVCTGDFFPPFPQILA